jgi:hypothetical protein
MPDFTLYTFHQLASALKNHHYTFQTFADFLKNPATRTIILRHDVDARKMNSLKTAQLENELGITGTYYFRMIPQSFDEEVIKQIASLGHEIGYHYEDLSRCAVSGWRQAAENKDPLLGESAPLRRGVRGGLSEPHKGFKAQRYNGRKYEEQLMDIAIASFRENLEKLRRVVPVETICMHGSPLSKYDNRMLWEKYDYRDYGIIGEPYFDINFEEVLYLTDTGRKWDGDLVNIRDKATGDRHQASGEEKRNEVWGIGFEVNHTLEKRNPTPRTPHPAPIFSFHSTFDIINAAESLPDKIMITVHPQRWDNRYFPWMRELIWQNIKNIGKRLIAHKERL